MGELGSIFERDDGAPTGPDLRVTVRIPRTRDDAPLRVHVPLEIAHEGGYVRRADPHGDGTEIRLSVPPSVPTGAVLRLRGLGGVGAGPAGRAGDLYVALDLVDGGGDMVVRPPGATGRALPWIGAAVLVVAGVLLRACLG